MSTTYRTAIVGCGNISHTHASTYRRHPCIDLAAGADIDAERLAAFRERWEVPAGYGDYREMLAEVKPELVSICTYAKLHWPMLKACAEAGVRGIICEKPMLNSPAELPLVRELVDQTGVKIVLGHMRRYGMAHLRARELVLGGEIGDPILVVGTLTGGGLAEMGSHWIDLMRHLIGDPEVVSVLAQTNMHDGTLCGHAQEDDAVLLMEFAGGIKGLFESGQTTLKDNVLTLIVGSQGSIQILGEDDLVISGPDGVRKEDLMVEQPEQWKALGLELPEPWWNYKWDILLREYLAWVDGGEAPLTCADQALKATEAYMAGYLSAIRREKIHLPLPGKDLTLDEWPGDVLARLASDRSV